MFTGSVHVYVCLLVKCVIVLHAASEWQLAPYFQNISHVIFIRRRVLHRSVIRGLWNVNTLSSFLFYSILFYSILSLTPPPAYTFQMPN